MKRLFNSFLLISTIAPQEVINNEQTFIILFALLCLQSQPQFENFYNYLVVNRKELSIKDIQDINMIGECGSSIESDTVDLENDNILKKSGMSPDQLDLIQDFCEALFRVIDINGDNSISDDEIKKFKEILDFSSVTASIGVGNEMDEIKTGRTMFYAKISDGTKIQPIVFRSAFKNGASLGAMAYVMIKQYVANNPSITVDELNEKLIREKTTADWLIPGETTVFSCSAIKDYLEKDEDGELTEHFLTHFFTEDYKRYLSDVNDTVGLIEKGTSGMQQTFSPIKIGDEKAFIGRYWSQKSVEKMITNFILSDYFSLEIDGVRKELNAFDKAEVIKFKKI